MKKKLGAIVIVVLLGTMIGKLWVTKEKAYESSKEVNSVYFLLENCYEEETEAKEKAEKFSSFTILKQDGRYCLYLGMTRDKDNALKIQELWKKQNVSLSRKEFVVENDKFLSELSQYDVLLKNAKKQEEIEGILKSIFSTYDETVLLRP